MDHLAAQHTRLVEQEDDLLSQMETCQQLIFALLSHLRQTDEPLHPKTVKEMAMAWRSIENAIQDKLTEVQLEMIFLLRCRKKESEVSD